MRYNILSINILLILFASNCGNGNSVLKSSESENIDLLEHVIFDEEIYDAPIKTQVTLHVIITDDSVNKDKIGILLNALYSKVMKRSDFNYRTSPSSSFIYAYDSKEKAQSGMGQWLGMISKSHADTHSSVRFNDIQLSALNEVQETKWNLSYEQRQEIWKELVKSEDKSQNEADKKYPLDKSNITLDDMNKNSEYNNQLRELYAKKLASKLSIPINILDSISTEAFVNGWPFPESN